MIGPFEDTHYEKPFYSANQTILGKTHFVIHKSSILLFIYLQRLVYLTKYLPIMSNLTFKYRGDSL